MSTPADTPLEDRRVTALSEGGEIRVHDRRRFARRRSDHDGPAVGELEAVVNDLRARVGDIREIHSELAAAREIVVALRGELRAAQSELAAERVASRRARMQAAWLEGELGRREDRERELRNALASLTSVLGDRSAALTGTDALEREREARARAESELREIRAELAGLRDAEAPVVPDRDAVAGLRDALAELSWRPAGRDDAPQLADPPEFDLDAAAARLRSRQEGPEAEPEAEPLAARGLSPRSGPWLRDGLLELAASDPDRAERLALALVPAQAGLIGRPLSYGLILAGGEDYRVSVMAQGAAVGRLAEIPLDAAVRGPLAAVVPLLAGGARPRLPGTSIRGRRRLRPLIAARRIPLQLADLALVSSPLPARALLELALLGARSEQEIVVDVIAGAELLRVRVGAGQSTVCEPDGSPAAATLVVAAGRLARVLAGIEDAELRGDRTVIERLLDTLDGISR